MEYKESEIISKLSPLLQQLVPPIDKIQLLRLELARAIAESDELLAIKRRQMLWPKDKEMTELDRKIRLRGDVSQIERENTLLHLVWEIVADLIR